MQISSSPAAPLPEKGLHEVDPDQELFALGLANFANGLTQGFTVGASHSRTAVDDMYNGQTQLAGILGAVFLGFFLLFFTGLLKKVPVVALSAIVVAAGLRLLRPKEFLRILRKHRTSGYVTIATTLSVLLLGIMTGILISVGLAIIIILRKLSRPHETISRHPDLPGLMIYRFGAPLLFFNAPYFAARVQAAIDSAEPPVKFLLVNAEAMIEIDWQAVDTVAKTTFRPEKTGYQPGLLRSQRPFPGGAQRQPSCQPGRFRRLPIGRDRGTSTQGS